MESQEMVCCPYNNSHKFSKSKFLWHLSRCKDKDKVQHLYTKCRYNALHILLKQKILEHEDVCPDRETHQTMLYQFRQTIRTNRYMNNIKVGIDYQDRGDSSRSRSRSREKKDNKNEEDVKQQQGINKFVSSCCDSSNMTLEECYQCLNILKAYLLSTNATGEDQISKLYTKYKKL